LRIALLGSILLALIGVGPADAASCKKYKETKNCKLPNGTSFQYTAGANDEMNLTGYRGKGELKKKTLKRGSTARASRA